MHEHSNSEHLGAYERIPKKTGKQGNMREAGYIRLTAK